jgi:hypothetical protein
VLKQPDNQVPPNSRVYVQRRADAEIEGLLLAETGVLVVHGSRQAGKSSLILRALRKAAATRKVVRLDLSSNGVSDSFHLLSAVATKIASAHNVAAPDLREDTYHRVDEFLSGLQEPTIVALDEFDFIRAMRDGYALLNWLRSWHDNSAFRRGSDVGEVLFVVCSFLPFYDLTVEFASPFNAGAEVQLSNFSNDEVSSLLRVYNLAVNDREATSCSDLPAASFSSCISAHTWSVEARW